MNFSLDEGSVFTKILFNSHELKQTTVVAPYYYSIFDSAYYTKGNFWGQGGPIQFSGYHSFYSETLGETLLKEGHSGPGGSFVSCGRKMFRAIINDSTEIRKYSDKIKPVIPANAAIVPHATNALRTNGAALEGSSTEFLKTKKTKRR